MSDATRSKPPQEASRISRLVDEFGRMLRLRRDLAELEIRHDYRLVRRFAVTAGVGVALTLVAVPLLLFVVAHGLEGMTRLSRVDWLLIFGLALVVPGLTISVVAVRKFRTGFCGLRSTLAELNEDLVWLREWTGRSESESDDDASAHHDSSG